MVLVDATQVASAASFIVVGVASALSATTSTLDATACLVPGTSSSASSNANVAALVAYVGVALVALGAAVYVGVRRRREAFAHHRRRVRATVRNASQATTVAVVVATAGIVAHAVALARPDAYTARAAAATVGGLAALEFVVYVVSTQSFPALIRRLPDAPHVHALVEAR